MSKESTISIVGKNLEFEQVLFVSAVVIPAIRDALRDEGIRLEPFESSVKKPEKLCDGYCRCCLFEHVCYESEEVK